MAGDVEVVARREAPPGSGAEVAGVEAYMDFVGVSRYLDIPIETLRAWRKRGRFVPAFKVGKLLRWRREEVDAWMRAHLEQPSSRGKARVEYPQRALQRSCS